MLGRAGSAVLSPSPDLRRNCAARNRRRHSISAQNRSCGTDPASDDVDGEVWEARFGFVVAKKPSDEHGIMYDTLGQHHARADSGGCRDDLVQGFRHFQQPRTGRGSCCRTARGLARLVLIANGLNIGLRTMLGIERQVISPCHSITLGFDVAPVGRAAFDFPALTYWPKRSSSRMAYLSIFRSPASCAPT